MISEKKVLVNNLLINYKFSPVLGSKANILILHGWRSSSDVFVGLIRYLNENGYSVLAPDLPAFGKSEIPKVDFNNDFLMDTVLKLANKIEFKPDILLGHSNGGAISTKIVLYGKLNIQKLVLVCSAGIRDKRLKKSVLKYASKVVKPIFKPSFMQPIRKKIYKLINSSDYLESAYIQESYKNIISEDLTEDFKKLSVTTQIIWGENDKETPLYYGKLLNQYIESSKFDVVKNVGHFPFLDNPTEFNKILLGFLNHE